MTTVVIYPNGSAVAGSLFSKRPARIVSETPGQMTVRVAGYRYTQGARAGNSRAYRSTGYAPAETLTGKIVSDHRAPSGLRTVELD